MVMLMSGDRVGRDASIPGARVVNSGQAEEETPGQSIRSAGAQGARSSFIHGNQQTRTVCVQRLHLNYFRQHPESCMVFANDRKLT